MTITVTRESDDRLSREVWNFAAIRGFTEAIELRLQVWQREKRPTRRHGFNREGEGWKAKVSRESRAEFGYSLSADMVPLPDDVIEDARRKVMEQLTVVGAKDPDR